jgi:hypothetical protein
MSKAIALTITEEEYAELEAVLDRYVAGIENDHHAPEQQPEYDELDGRAKLEVWLDALQTQRHTEQGEHERAMERVDRNLAAIKSNLEIIRNSREATCGKNW